MRIETATGESIAEIQAIYAHHVLNGTGTFDEVPPSVEEVGARFARGMEAGYDWVVARDATGVLGYASCGPFRARSAYDWTVEDSVYVRNDVRGQGVGRALLAELVSRAERRGFRQMVALIGDSENEGSVGVHASLGFVRVGLMRGVGFKFGRWLDVAFYQLTLDTPERPVDG
jgi:phosphinothricin acetyltransferase